MIEIISTFCRELEKSFFLTFYYLIAQHLPASYSYSLFGRFSKKCRGFACKRIFHYFGHNVNIEQGAYFGSGRLIEIGDNSGIGVNCYVPSNVRIGKDVMMGPDVIIISQNQSHNFDRIDIPMRLQGHRNTPAVFIEDDVWLGARVIVLSGVRVGRGAVIGAGAIITKDIPPFAICVGNPARIVRFRNESKE